MRTTVLPALMLLVGLAIVVRTVAAGGLRLYAERRR